VNAAPDGVAPVRRQCNVSKDYLPEKVRPRLIALAQELEVLGFERHQAVSGDFGGAPLFDALIGRDFLQRYMLVVDYPRQRFELHPAARAPNLCGKPTATILPNTDGMMLSTVQTDHVQ
jgi:hypothetical protein